MSIGTRLLLSACAGLVLTACDDGLLAPNRRLSSLDVTAARASDPVTLSSGPASASDIWLSWNDNARNESGWEVHRSTTGAAGPFTLRASLPENSTSFNDGGLAAFSENCYRVRSFRKQGPNISSSAFSNVSCSTTYGPPTAPSGLNAVPEGSSWVNVTWTDNATTETGLRLERSADPAGPWQTAAALGVNASTYGESRPPEQLVCYRAIATNSWGGSAPSNVDCTAAPEWPRDIAAVAGTSSITVGWADASNVEDGYEVQRALDDFIWAVVANLPAGATSFVDNSVVPDTRHWYRVRAKKDGGFSYFSGYASAAVATRPPDPPTMYGASPAGSTAASVSWNNTSITTSSFRVERSTDGQASWATAGSHSVENGTFFYDGDRTPESEACYRVFASNARGESGPSAVDCTIPPARPTNLAYTDNGDGSITLTWTDNSNVEDSYAVFTVYCDWYYCYWNVYNFEANATTATLYLSSTEYFDGVYAAHDGGYSDAAAWAGSGGLAIVSSTPAVRPTKGARAPRPSADARAARLSDRMMVGRTPPKR
jgi:hypothetical protein